MIYVEKNGYLPQKKDTKQLFSDKQSTAELRVALQEINPTISKLKKKIAEQPNSKKAEGWAIEQHRLLAIKADIISKIKAIEHERA